MTPVTSNRRVGTVYEWPRFLAYVVLISLQITCFPSVSHAGLLLLHHANEARDQIEQAVKEQTRSVEAIAQVSESVSDPAVQREIKSAMAGLQDGISQISSVGLKTVETLQDVENKMDELLVNNEELKTRVTEIKGQRNTAYAVSVVIAILAMLFRWPFLERKLKKLEIQAQQRNLRE